jgi:hypothetical protein
VMGIMVQLCWAYIHIYLPRNRWPSSAWEDTSPRSGLTCSFIFPKSDSLARREDVHRAVRADRGQLLGRPKGGTNMAYAGFPNLGGCWSRAPFVDITPAVYGRNICDSANRARNLIFIRHHRTGLSSYYAVSYSISPFCYFVKAFQISAKTYYANSSPTSLSLISQSLLAFSLSAAKGAGSTTWQFSRYAPECSAQTLSAPHDLISRSYEGEGALPSSAGSNAATTCVAEPCP